jgi:hypothetical protein
MKTFFGKVKSKFSTFFLTEEGGKKVIRKKEVKYTLVICLLITACFQIFWPEDNSGLGKSYKPLNEGQTVQLSNVNNEATIKLQSKEEADQQNGKPQGSRDLGLSRPSQLVYNSRQVLERIGSEGTLTTPLPSGTNFIAKLVNGIDTREANQVAKVILPYGARHASGGFLPKNAILLGIVSYGGESEKIFIRFNRVIYPNGKEFKIDAQALNSADYSPGLLGVNHSNSDIRMASSIGLTMVSAATDVLTKRSMLGGINPFGMDTAQPDATAQNAMLQGVSQVTKQEAQRQAQDMQKAQEYVTLYSDSDLIISLLSPFNGEAI